MRKSVVDASRLLFVLTCFLCGACAHTSGTGRDEAAVEASANVSLAPVESRNQASNFELKDLRGNIVNLSDYRGKVLSVNFWASWCEPCKQELTFFDGFISEYGDQGFAVLAVAADAPETVSKVRTIARRKRWQMPVLLDTEGTVSAIHNPRGAMPFTLLIDRAGRVALAHEGFTSGDEVMYKPLIQQLLAEK